MLESKAMQMQQMIDGIETYHPSSKFNPLSVPIMLGIGGVLGIAAAFVIHLIWQFTGFYLIVIFPGIIGAAAGFGLNIGIQMGKCRNVYIAIIAALLIGGLSYVSMHYFDSRSFGTTDLLAYLHAMADEGFSFFFIPISGVFAWLVWVIELGIVMFVSVGMAGGSSSAPFCEKCNSWFNGHQSIYASNDSTDGVVSALYHQEYDRLKELENTKVGERNRLELQLEFCDGCQENGYVTVTRVLPKGDDDDKEEEELVSRASIPQFGLGTLLRDFQPQFGSSTEYGTSPR